MGFSPVLVCVSTYEKVCVRWTSVSRVSVLFCVCVSCARARYGCVYMYVCMCVCVCAWSAFDENSQTSLSLTPGDWRPGSGVGLMSWQLPPHFAALWPAAGPTHQTNKNTFLSPYIVTLNLFVSKTCVFVEWQIQAVFSKSYRLNDGPNALGESVHGLMYVLVRLYTFFRSTLYTEFCLS